MPPARSTTGCFACKTKRKKCDETKPHCLRCQRSRTPCPGYTYIHDPDKPNKKPRTLQAPRTVRGSRATLSQTTPPANTGLQSPRVASQALHGVSGKLSEDSRLASSSSLRHPMVDLPTLDGTSNSELAQTSVTTRMTSGQASLLAALFSLGQAPPQLVQRSTNSNVSSTSNWARDTEKQVRSQEGDGSEDIVTVIRPELVLDQTAESNALPFVIQGYAAWIRRLAIEPLKLMRASREFVLSHFDDGDQSRLIIGLLANVGSRIASVQVVGKRHQPMISALHSAVLWRLETVKSRSKPTRSELVKALDSATELLAIHFHTNSPIKAMTLRQEAASVFRKLCPEPPGAPLNLSSLLYHPLGCLRHYAGMSAISSVFGDVPTLFQYDITIPTNQPALQEDGIIQCLFGIPNPIMILFAKMKEVQQDGLLSNVEETVELLEYAIREVPPFNGSSSDRFLAVMRSVVHEGWRQAAFVYLYMAVCGDSSDTPRVKDAFGRFIRLLNGTKPGRLPDEFLTSPLILIAPAARRNCDREVIRRRAVVLHRRDRTYPTNDSLLCIVEDYWARADAEGRPVVWSDVAVSRRQVLGS